MYKLIAFKSITPESNGAVEYIGKLLAEHNFSVEIKEFDKDYKVQNLYASFGNSRPNICFAGDVDVVPPGNLNSWDSDPFIAFNNDGKIFGRGAVDMKGAIACMLAATLNSLKLNKNPLGQIRFLLTSDEEGEVKYDTRAMLEYLQEKDTIIDLMILGEPTSEQQVGDTIKIGRRGSINFNLNVKGVQGHVAYLDKAYNPLNHLVNILQDLNNLLLDSGNEFFQSSQLMATSIDTNNSISTVIPATVSAKFNIRFNDIHSPDSLISLIKQKIELHTKNYTLTSQLSAAVFIQEPVGLIQRS